MFHLNRQAGDLCKRMAAAAESLGIRPLRLPGGPLVLDCGVDAPGGREAGILLARVCLADLAAVEVVDGDRVTAPWPAVRVATEQPVAACLASQYAGWEVKGEHYFAMGSGPMRASAAREPLFEEPLLAELARRETSAPAVGILEAAHLPPAEICLEIARRCHIGPAELTLLVAPTSSPAGNLQVVARSVETALHKLHALGFDLSRQVVAGQRWQRERPGGDRPHERCHSLWRPGNARSLWRRPVVTGVGTANAQQRIGRPWPAVCGSTGPLPQRLLSCRSPPFQSRPTGAGESGYGQHLYVWLDRRCHIGRIVRSQRLIGQPKNNYPPATPTAAQ